MSDHADTIRSENRDETEIAEKLVSLALGGKDWECREVSEDLSSIEQRWGGSLGEKP